MVHGKLRNEQELWIVKYKKIVMRHFRDLMNLDEENILL